MAEWSIESIEALTTLYVETDITSDTLVKDKNKLSEFTNKLNLKLVSEENYTDEEVATKLFRLRKAKKLPKIRS